MAHIAGLVAAGIHPSPVPMAEFVTSTTHKTLRGPRGGLVLCKEQYAKTLNSQIFPGIQGGPLMHVIAAKAVAFREALTPEFKAYQRQIVANAQALAEALASEGMRPVTGGTDTHLALLDLQGTGVTGKDAEARCDRAGIVLNKNAIPYDPQPASVASGVRVGTPSVTTQGMTEGDMKEIGSLIGRAVRDADGSDAEDVRRSVTALVQAHPAYGRAEPARATSASTATDNPSPS
jgi:glycine hydroxymethyltransferase